MSRGAVLTQSPRDGRGALAAQSLYAEEMSMILPPPSAARISDACASIDPVFTQTPIVRQEAAEAVLGCRLIAKVETLNPIRSFKGRGTSWFVHGVATHESTVT